MPPRAKLQPHKSESRLRPSHYLVLGMIVLFGGTGDVALAFGMKQMGAVSRANWTMLLAALLNPWVLLGILLLIGFFTSYLTALSRADLTYVLPATAFGYVVVAFLSQWLLGEHVTLLRWLGILLVTAGVSFVAGGRTTTAPLATTEATHKPL